MKVINLGEKNSILNKFVAQMRDKGIQKDSMRFRRNLERLGEIFAYEISQHLDYTHKDYVTPLGIASIPTYDSQIVVATILRAGLPLHQGILNFFDDAQNAFVAAYRKYDKGEDFHINIEYASTPDHACNRSLSRDRLQAPLRRRRTGAYPPRMSNLKRIRRRVSPEEPSERQGDLMGSRH